MIERARLCPGTRGNKCRRIIAANVMLFAVVLPSVCVFLDLRHSVYYVFYHAVFVAGSTASDNTVLESLTMQNEDRLTDTRNFLRDYLTHRDQIHKPGFSLLNDGEANQDDRKIKVAITIVASPRGSYSVGQTTTYSPKYLSQNVAKFLKLIRAAKASPAKDSIEYRLVVCDVAEEMGEEALELSSILKDTVTFIHYQDSAQSRQPLDPSASLLNSRLFRFYKEKRDYSFCINRTKEETNAGYILLVEDDAIPKDSVLNVVSYLVVNFLESTSHFREAKSKHNVSYFKMYHPKRLSGYISMEVERIPELIATGAVIGSCFFLFHFLLYRCTNQESGVSPNFQWATCCAYATICVLLIGRPHLQCWRYMSPQLYSITPDAFCCTQGLLFPTESAIKLSEYISAQPSDTRDRKDDCVFKFQKEYKPGYLVQPNSFEHVGVMSSLRKKVVDPHIMLE